MFGLGDTELLLIIIFAFLLFGPDKLPSMGRTIGRGIKQFRQASDSVTKVVKTEVLNPLSEAAKTEAGTPASSSATEASEIPRQLERPTETFAERRARLAREREEREAAAAAETPLAADAVATEDREDGEPAATESPRAKAPATHAHAAAAEPTPETPAKPTTVASIWGLDDGVGDSEAALVETGEEDAAIRSA